MKWKIFLCMCLFVSQYAFANYSQTKSANLLSFSRSQIKPVVMVSGGPTFITQKGNSAIFWLNPSSFAFSADRSTQTQGAFGIFAGGLFPIRSQWAMQLGLAYYYNMKFSQTGNLVQGVDADSSDHFSYEYDITVQQLLLEAKLMWNGYRCYYPYIYAGFGAAFNRATNYSTNNPPTLTFTPQFTNNNQNSFSYSIGLGLDADIYKNWRFGVGYRFASFGTLKLGSGRINTVPISGTLTQSNLYADEILAQFTYIIT